MVLPEDDGGALALGNKDAEPIALARWALDAGAHSAWVLGNGSHTRGIDLVAHGADSGVLDYPLPPSVDGQAPRSLPAALAALLASGLPLTEAIDGAHRFARNPGNPIFSVAAR